MDSVGREPNTHSPAAGSKTNLIFDLVDTIYISWLTIPIAMAHAHPSVQVQNLTIADVALGTLAARTAFQLSTQFSTTIDRTFLMKKLKYIVMISGLTAGEGPFTIGLAPGDASLAEIKAAYDDLNSVGPSDLTQERTQDNIWNILQNTWVPLTEGANATIAQALLEVPLGKGFPAIENQGVQLVLFSHDGGALTTGSVVKGTVQIWGVWLK